MTSPISGPPRPGQHLAAGRSTVSPDVVAQRVDELIAQVDALRAADRATDSVAVDLGVLERQAVLLEQAHQVLSVALEDLDRAS